jgi:hypothetical protein
VTCVYCHEDVAGTPTACPNCGLPTSDPGTPGRAVSVLDRTLSWSRTSFAGFFDRLRHGPGGIWAIPLAVGLVAGLFLGLGYALGTHGEQPVAQNLEPTTSAPTSAPQSAPIQTPPVQTAAASLPVTPEAVTPVITQRFIPADEEVLPPKPVVTPPAGKVDGVDYFAEPKVAAKPKPRRTPRLRYPNWAMYETSREALPPPHVLAMNPYRERSPIYVYMMGIEHPYLNDVSTSWDNNNPYGPGTRLDFTGE